jgi:hypothetical protein
MSKPEPTPIERWASEIESLSKKLHAHAKAIMAAGDDPFAQREHIDRTDKALCEISLGPPKPPTDLRTSIDTACVEAKAEFWQRFGSAAKDAGWLVHGSTERRLVACAFFVELKNDTVAIEGVPGKYSPHVPAVIGTLKPHIDSLTVDKGSLQRFSELLGEAYDAVGGQGEASIETVFRQCVLLVQSATFWATVEPSKFQALSRPMFRCRLSAMLAENVRSLDGRELRLTPTVNRKDVWELFSPAEGRVVQVGRIAFFKR